MSAYKSKYGKLHGSSYDELAPLARKEFQRIKKLTKRQPYVRSAYLLSPPYDDPLYANNPTVAEYLTLQATRMMDKKPLMDMPLFTDEHSTWRRTLLHGPLKPHRDSENEYAVMAHASPSIGRELPEIRIDLLSFDFQPQSGTLNHSDVVVGRYAVA